MKRWAVGAALVALCGTAAAQSVWGQLVASDDTDGLRETLTTIGYRSAQGFGLKASALQYRAPGWREEGALIGATYQRHDPTLQLDASLGLARLADHDHAVGSLDMLWPLAVGSAVGLSVERDIVNSVAGIEAGVTFTSLVMVADHAFSERFNVGLAAGTALFSNDNQRPLLRTRWNFELVPTVGLNAYLKTRSYQNSDPYRPEYFSPARLNEVSAGLSSRLAVAAGVVLSAALDGGTQHTESGSKRIWSYALRLGSQRSEAIQWSLALEGSNAAGASLANASDDYRYTRAMAQVSVPF